MKHFFIYRKYICEVIFNYGNKTKIMMHLLYPADQSKLGKFLYFKGLIKVSLLDQTKGRYAS